MKWEKDAETAVNRAPFFVRKRIRKRVEEEAKQAGAGKVTLAHVRASQQRFLHRMEDEVRGWQVESCFGPNGCPNRAVADDDLAGRLEDVARLADLRTFLKEHVSGPLKMHHEFRITVSDCPNACSRPQIADVGLIGARRPRVLDDVDCSLCGTCVEVCRESALELGDDRPRLDPDKCLSCGKCIEACPTGTMAEEARGYRLQVGGRLGRHPQLARELEGIYSAEEAVEAVERCLDLFKANYRDGARFGEIIEVIGTSSLEKKIKIVELT